MDDLRVIVAYRSSDLESKNLASNLITQLRNNTYHPSMTLELEECSVSNFKFLEGQVQIQKNYFSSYWVSRNFESLQKLG
jgi:hypothetical protein